MTVFWLHFPVSFLFSLLGATPLCHYFTYPPHPITISTSFVFSHPLVMASTAIKKTLVDPNIDFRNSGSVQLHHTPCWNGCKGKLVLLLQNTLAKGQCGMKKRVHGWKSQHVQTFMRSEKAVIYSINSLLWSPTTVFIKLLSARVKFKDRCANYSPSHPHPSTHILLVITYTDSSVLA